MPQTLSSKAESEDDGANRLKVLLKQFFVIDELLRRYLCQRGGGRRRVHYSNQSTFVNASTTPEEFAFKRLY